MGKDEFTAVDFFGRDSGYAVKEKQDFSSAMKNATDFLVDGVMNYIGEDRKKAENEISEYRALAKKAFYNRQYSDSRKYYELILELDSNDYEAAFYNELCKGLSSTVSESTILQTYKEYKRSIMKLPMELNWDEIIDEMSIQIADLVIAWYKQSKQISDKNVGDWYSYNIKEFYRHADLSKKAVDYMDLVMPNILKSNLGQDEIEFPYAFWYCSMCRDYCCETMYYTINDRDTAITSNRYVKPLGYSVDVKKAYIEKYDEMCFEIRKFDPTFQRIEDEWDSGFDRTNPPTTYEGQQQDNKFRRVLQLQKDKEIDARISRWKANGGPKEINRNYKIHYYLSEHKEERAKYQELQKRVFEINDRLSKENQECIVCNEELEKNQIRLEKLRNDIDEANRIINKLTKKIFGKMKAQERIQEERHNIDNYENQITSIELEIVSQQDNVKKYMDIISNIKSELTSAERQCEMYINNCII